MSKDSVQRSPNPMATRWLTEEVFKLIGMVQNNEAIYNQRHKNYFCRPYVENFWREVDRILGKNPGASLAKWTNLRISFRREYTNYLDEKISPCWTYFDSMFFLHPFLRKKNLQPKSLDTQVQNALAQLSDLSNRFERAQSLTYSSTNTTPPVYSPNHTNPTDNFINYFDENDNLQHSDFVDLTDDDRELKPYDNLDSEIKSECDDQAPDIEQRAETTRACSNGNVDSADSKLDDNIYRPLRRCPNYSIQLRNHNEDHHERPLHSEDSHINSPGVSTTQSHPNIARPAFMPNACAPSSTIDSAGAVLPNRQSSSTSHQPRFEKISATRPANSYNMPASSAHNDICDCKTDPDALFLMSLLPDIQKLNGRDRGKIKIAFQNILQDYLYPD